jgi:hypothetical protein
MNSKEEKALVDRIIKLHGAVIDLRTNPGVMIEILRRFETPDAGSPCGGVPDPPPPPSPSKVGDRITNEDIMKAVLKLSREVNAIQKALPKGRARGR